MPNAWIQHVKKFARENNMAYGCAVSDPRCKASYKKPAVIKKTKVKVSIPVKVEEKKSAPPRLTEYLRRALAEEQAKKDIKTFDEAQEFRDKRRERLRLEKEEKKSTPPPPIIVEEKKLTPAPSVSKFYPMATREQLRANRRPRTKMVSKAKRYKTKKEIAEEDKIFEEKFKKWDSPEGQLQRKLNNLFENFKSKHLYYRSSQYRKEDAKAKYIPEIAKLMDLPVPTNEEEELKFLNKFLKSLYYGNETKDMTGKNEITDKKEFLRKRDIFMGYGRKRKTTKRKY